MIKPSDIIHLSPLAFWDTDMNKLDYEAQADYIIRKVFDYGSWEDVLEVTAYYGKEKVKEALVEAPYLKESTLYFSSLLLNIPRHKFKCYNTRQLHPIQ
jgi:hypothetical protein